MDMDVFGVDELLDFSINDPLFMISSTSSSATLPHNINHHHFPYLHNPTTNFNLHLCVPNEDIAELGRLSNFVDDSFTEFRGTMNDRSDASINGGCPLSITTWTTDNNDVRCNAEGMTTKVISRREKSSAAAEETLPRKCTHCSSEKTPQWRTGPLGPKTLCNACGVRYKSGRLVPEYRPAASPTFVLSQHSNSHRKVMELRRQKEQQQDAYGNQHRPLQGCRHA